MKKYFKVLSVVMALILCMLVVVACSDKEEDKQETQQLAAPTGLIINNDVASWSAVSNAGGYIIKVDASEHSVSSATTFDLGTLTLDDGTYQVSVKASGKTVGNTKYTDSAYSSSVEYTVKTTIADGIYAGTSATFNGQALDLSDPYTGAHRDLYEFILYSSEILNGIAILENTFPGFDFYDFNTLKLIMSSQFDFTGITNTEQFWYAYVGSLVSDEMMNELIPIMADEIRGSAIIVIEGNKITISDTYSSTFTLNNGVIVLDEPLLEGAFGKFPYTLSLAYSNGVIIMTENLPNDNVYVVTCEFYEAY